MQALLLLLIILVCACNNEKAPAPQQPADKPVYFAFAPRKAITADKGDKTKAAIVLDIWRGISSGNISGFSKYFADSVVLIFPDRIYSGRKDTVLNAYQQRRNQLEVLQIHMDYWIPAEDEETGESQVLLWMQQEGTKKNRQMESKALHQVWWFDQAGSIYKIQEFHSHWHW